MLKHINWLKLQALNWSSKPTSFNYISSLNIKHFAKFLCVVKLLSLIVELLIVIDGGLLVLLILGDKVVHVGLGLGELHLVHAFALKRKRTLNITLKLKSCLSHLCTNGGKPSF